jgi:hypothetical protein
MLDWNNEDTKYELVRCDRATGKRQVLSDRGEVAGRFPAEAEMNKLRDSNRDPNVEFELKVVRDDKPFRATAFDEGSVNRLA